MGNARDRYIIHYETKHLSNTDLVRFFYELKGRGNNPGIINKTNSQFLAKSLVEIPANSIELWRYFLEKWSCKYRLIKKVSKSDANNRLFIFNSSRLSGSRKVRFFYKLKGRGNKKGILDKLDAEFVAKSVILVSMKNYFALIKFLREWDCDFDIKEVRC